MALLLSDETVADMPNSGIWVAAKMLARVVVVRLVVVPITPAKGGVAGIQVKS